MRRSMLALLSAIVTGLLIVPSGVSAGTVTSVVQDNTGDVGFGIDHETGWILRESADNTPIVQAGYFDIASTWLSLKVKTYTFGMELATALPTEGTALPGGIKLAEWAMWIDPSPYNYFTNPVAPLFLIALRYDGSSYAAFVMDYGTKVAEPVSFSVDGAKFQLEFTSASIGNLAFKWWSPLVREWTGPLGSAGSWFVDGIDPGSAPGQDGIDLPWPPV